MNAGLRFFYWKEPLEFMHHCSTKWATSLENERRAVLSRTK